MADENTRLISAVVKRLSKVIDPETGANVIRMRLIEDIILEKEGIIHYTFRPSSPVCPLAVPLAVDIRRAVSEVPGILGQVITVKGYLHARSLTERLNALGDPGK